MICNIKFIIFTYPHSIMRFFWRSKHEIKKEKDMKNRNNKKRHLLYILTQFRMYMYDAVIHIN